MRGVGLLAGLSWLGWAYVVLEVAPESALGRVAFFGALGLALTATFSLAAYRLSFSLFADPRRRGNLARSLQHGAVLALACTAAAVLQSWRALTPLAIGLLLALCVAGQIAILLRE